MSWIGETRVVDRPYDPPRLAPVVIADLVTRRIAEHTPMALIRLGDGELTLLGLGSHTTPRAVKRILNIYFGPAHPTEEMLESFVEELRNAVRAADVIGLPRVSRQRNDQLSSYFSPVFERYSLNTPGVLYSDSGLHHFFQFMRAFDDWLRGLPFLGLITCRDVREQVAATFNIPKVLWHAIPADFHTSNEVPPIPHFPDIYERLRVELAPPFKGAVYLVGAGAFAKVYCHWIKSRGGIAIDIGSLFDGWAGIVSRDRIEENRSLFSLERYRSLTPRAERIAEYREITERTLANKATAEERAFLTSH